MSIAKRAYNDGYYAAINDLRSLAQTLGAGRYRPDPKLEQALTVYMIADVLDGRWRIDGQRPLRGLL